MQRYLILSLTLVCLLGCEETTDAPPGMTPMADAGQTLPQTPDATTSPPSPTDPSTPATPGLTNEQLVHDGVTRDYLRYLPAGYDGTAALPVLFNFHGFGLSANQQLEASDMRSLADAEGIILVYPQGTISEGETHWNTFAIGGINKSMSDDVGFIRALIDSMEAELSIDANRIYATGYSNGGDFTYTLACNLSDRIAAIAPVSGSMWEQTQQDCTPSHPVAYIGFNGTNDFDRPYDGFPDYLLPTSDILSYWAAHNNITTPPSLTTFESAGRTVERYDYTGGTNGVAMTHYKVINGLHVWFSIEDDGANIDQLIWTFLSRFDQNGAR